MMGQTTVWRLVVDGVLATEGFEIRLRTHANGETQNPHTVVATLPAAGLCGRGDSRVSHEESVRAAIFDLAANLLRAGCFVELVPPGKMTQNELFRGILNATNERVTDGRESLYKHRQECHDCACGATMRCLIGRAMKEVLDDRESLSAAFAGIEP